MKDGAYKDVHLVSFMAIKLTCFEIFQHRM